MRGAPNPLFEGFLRGLLVKESSGDCGLIGLADEIRRHGTKKPLVLRPRNEEAARPKESGSRFVGLWKESTQTGIRTQDQLVKSQLLYQLSYLRIA